MTEDETAAEHGSCEDADNMGACLGSCPGVPTSVGSGCNATLNASHLHFSVWFRDYQQEHPLGTLVKMWVPRPSS